MYLAADSLEATLDNSLLLSDWIRKQQKVKAYVGYVRDPENWRKEELTHLFTGKIDGVKPGFSNPYTVKVICRDLSAPMIDTEYSVAYVERTSSQLASMFAEKYKLKPRITKTTEIISKDMYSDKREWEMLQMLADLEGFVCYVTKDEELVFGPRNESDEAPCATLYSGFTGMPNCKIEFADSSVGVINKITVRHWLSKNKVLIEATSQNDALIKSMGYVKERLYYISKAKTKAMAQQYADKLLKENSRQVVTATGSCEGNIRMYAEGKVLTKGFGRFDGSYYLDRVTHSLSKSSGYTCEFDATNLRPENANQYRNDLYDYKEKKY
mgnify:FL=1